MTDKSLEVIDAEVVAITPMTLIQQAQAGDASIEQMQQLFELQLRWEANEAQKAYTVAMTNFRSECPTINRTVKGQSNKYAGLAETAEVIDPILSKHGLSYRWSQSQDTDKKELTVSCVVTHVGGHSESTPLTAGMDTGGNKNAIQALGSSNKYLFRYTLEAALGLASREFDDDGKAASVPPVAVIDEDQWQRLDILIDEVGADRDKFCVAYQVDCLENLPAKQFEHAVKALEKKRKS